MWLFVVLQHLKIILQTFDVSDLPPFSYAHAKFERVEKWLSVLFKDSYLKKFHIRSGGEKKIRS